MLIMYVSLFIGAYISEWLFYYVEDNKSLLGLQ